VPDVLLKPSDLNADSTRLLFQWCIEIGSDEFSWSCLSYASSGAPFCVATEQALKSFSLPPAPRPHLTRPLGEPFIRQTGLWRFNTSSVLILNGLLPDGLFTDHQGNRDGWLEDVTLYRSSQILLGVVTHEHEATLRASDVEVLHLRERGLLPPP
jgi:hypothetical protein